MSLKTLPLLFINLGGEMIYILDQRLKAQEIPPDKAKKVMHDIAGTMLNKRFMEELFKPQEMYSKKAMRTVFDRLAHASIMRLNPASMDKLYDLMTMAFKYQVSLSLRPKDVMLITLNHMDSIRRFTEGSKSLTQQVENVFNLMIKTYDTILPGEFMLIRQTLLNFFQDNHIKVSIFLKDGVQGPNGRFILPLKNPTLPIGTEVPGTIKLYDAAEKEKQSIKFDPGLKYQKVKEEGSFKSTGSRNTALGANMYSVARAADTTTPSPQASVTAADEAPQAVAMGKASTSKDAGKGAAAGKAAQPSTASLEGEEPDMGGHLDPSAKEHLDMLSKLLTGAGGKPQGKGSDYDFRLNLFGSDADEEAAALLRTPTKHETMTVNIDATKRKENKALSKISGQMNVEEPGNDANLLDLMDDARQ